MQQSEKLLIIGTYCKVFRSEILGLTLQQFEEKTHAKVKTISAFENGNSSNIAHLFKYLDLCETREMRTEYLRGLNELLGGM